MKLKCDLLIQDLNKKENIEKVYKQSTIGICRPINGDPTKSTIILTVNTNTALKFQYKLNKVEIYTKYIKDGKSTINLTNQKTLLLISNVPPQNLINFLSFLRIKLKNRDSNGGLEANNNAKKSHVQNFLQNQPQDNLKNISPLTSDEIGHLMKAKPATNTPVRATSATNLRDVTNVNGNGQSKKSLFQKSTSVSSFPPKVTPNKPSMFKLTHEQICTLKAIKSGESLFFTGGAGTGKSFLLRLITKYLPQDACFITASTGIAASLIGGITLHSFAGIGANDLSLPVESIVAKIQNSKVKMDNWKKCRHLVIDEISMIDADFFDILEQVACIIRKNDQPFGGIQLILSGDFLQLPPVSKYNENKKYCFQAKSWDKCIKKVMQLTEVQRQSDKTFIKVLDEIRFGRCSQQTIDLLNECKHNEIEDKAILPTKLCTHKDDVDFINKMEIEKMKSDTVVYRAIDSDPMYRSLLNTMCTAKEELVLKKGAQVMLNKNLDLHSGLVNGSRGVVTGFCDVYKCPIVRFFNRIEMPIKLDCWSVKMTTSLVVTRKQIPLQLAWALSIHKSQGMTLDCAQVSLSRVFEYGQAYVALSRSKSLKNLKITDFDVSSIKASDVVVKYYENVDYHKPLKQTNLIFE